APGGGQDEALDVAPLATGFQEVECPHGVDVEVLTRIGKGLDDPCVRSQVNHDVHPIECPSNDRRVANVSLDELRAEPVEIFASPYDQIVENTNPNAAG